MSKALHKPTPSAPKWFFWDNDNCWFCDFRYSQKGCTGCKLLKRQNAIQKKRRDRKEKQQLRKEY